MKKPRCYNCKYAGQQFKLGKLVKLTHLHCEHPVKYSKEKHGHGEFCVWDTLRIFSDDCELHEFKDKATTE